jgi:DNA polymerase III alpha subunit (gram-positive type)
MQIKLQMLTVISEVQDIYVHYICKECKEKRWNSIIKANKSIKIT